MGAFQQTETLAHRGLRNSVVQWLGELVLPSLSDTASLCLSFLIGKMRS